MLWAETTFLWLLPLIAGVAALLVAALRRRAGALRAFADPALVARLAVGVDPRRRAWRLALRLAAMVLIVVALAGPKWGFHWEPVHREGIDLMIAMDTSRSMLATDVKPNRLERAKLAVLDLVARLEGDRIGLVAFAGTAFLEAPLTLDYAAFERSLRALHVGIIPRGGTAISRAIETSLQAFEAREGKYEALVLITDGEDNEGDAKAAAEQATARGVKIYTVGIGTAEGELLRLPGDKGYVKDRKGQVVKSRLDEGVLHDVAVASGGAYVRGIGPRLGLDEVFDQHIAKMERREVDSSLERRYEERFQLPLALALFLLAIESLMRLRRVEARRRRGWAALRRRGAGEAGRAAVAPLLLIALSPLLLGWLDGAGNPLREGNRLYDEGKYAEAVQKFGESLVDSPASPLLQYNLAAALYKEGKYSEAIAALDKVVAEGGAPWSAAANYNLGNAHFRAADAAEQSDPQSALQSYEQALLAYRRAMAADPADPDPKFNYEFAANRLAELRKRLEEEKQEQEKKEQEEQKQEEQQQEEQQQEEQQQEEQQQEEQQPEEQQQEQQEEQQQQEQQEEQQQEQQEQQQPEEQQEQQEQQQPDEAQQEEGAPQEQEKQDEAEQQPPAQPEEQEPQEQAAEAAEQPQAEPGEEPPPPGAAGGVAGDEAPENADQQAAHAILDTARSEELGPEDIDRPVTVRGLGEPAEDW